MGPPQPPRQSAASHPHHQTGQNEEMLFAFQHAADFHRDGILLTRLVNGTYDIDELSTSERKKEGIAVCVGRSCQLLKF